jgi:hypothetical protein
MDSNLKLTKTAIILSVIACFLLAVIIISGGSNRVSNVESNRVNEGEDSREMEEIVENSQESDSPDAEEVIVQQPKLDPKLVLIHKFYEDITSKNYEAAYAVAPLGRTFEEFVSIYNGVERIYTLFVDNSNTLHKLKVEITNTAGEKSYYDVVMDIQQKEDGSYYVAKAESQLPKNLFYVDYLPYTDRYSIQIKQSSTNLTTQDGANLLEWVDYLRTTIIPGKINGNSQFLIFFGGAGAQSFYSVYLYNNSTNTIEEVKVFEVWPIGNETDENGNFKAVVCNDYDVLSDTDPYLTPCMLQYKDKEWYKNNLEAQNELPKYIFND